MMKPNKDDAQIHKLLEWRCKNGPKSTILGDFLRSFGIFRGGKGTSDHQTGNFFLLDIWCTQ